MNEPVNAAAQKSPPQRIRPVWVSSGLTGIVLGAGAMVVAMHLLGYDFQTASSRTPWGTPGPSGRSDPAAPGGAMPALMPMGGGGGGRAKRNLTALVGKMELLSKGLQFELNAEQTARIAEQLAQLEQAEKMTSDQAQTHLEALEAILTDEQKATLVAIDLPRAGQPGGGGGGRRGAGPVDPMASMTAIAVPGGGGTGGGGGGGSDDENPFRQETGHKHLRDLLNRLNPSGAETPAKSE